MSESPPVDNGWEESHDSDQVTHVKGDVALSAAASGEWLVNISDQAVVPMSTTEVITALRTSRITETALVWRIGMQDWTALSEVPPLTLAAGKLDPNAKRVSPDVSKPVSIAGTSTTPPRDHSERVLNPPSKEPARAARTARDERRRKTTLPFGFPVAREPATPRATTTQQTPPWNEREASRPEASTQSDDSGALAVYERAAPSLTFSESVRAEWQRISTPEPAPVPVAAPIKLLPLTRLEPEKPSSMAPLNARSLVLTQPAARPPRPEPARAPRASEPRASEPRASEPRASEPRASEPRASEPRASEPRASESRMPNTLAPIVSEPRHDLPPRAPMWGDLSVVPARDLRAAQATSKRVTIAASLGSAVLASLLTLWFAHSSARNAAGATAAAVAPASAPAPALASGTALTVAAPSAEASEPMPLEIPQASAAKAARAPDAPRPAARKRVTHAWRHVTAKTKSIAAENAQSMAPSATEDTSPATEPTQAATEPSSTAVSASPASAPSTEAVTAPAQTAAPAPEAPTTVNTASKSAPPLASASPQL